jgi:hypothetical protein
VCNLYYRYFQQSDYADWVLVPDDTVESPWPCAAQHSASRVTVLALTGDPEVPRQPGVYVKYCGPLYFDIDDGNDLDTALNSARNLCDKLLEFKVAEEDIEIHLTGKKGVHIYVDPRVFLPEGELARSDLPDVYACMAKALFVKGMDFQVYSKEKGRMVRPPNGLRDAGIYKVRVTLSTLNSLDSEGYKEAVSVQRDCSLFPPKKLQWSTKLAEVFKTAVKSLEVTVKLTGWEPTDRGAVNAMGQTMPHCVALMVDGHRKNGKGSALTGFNNLAIQLGCWTKVTMVDDMALLASLHARVVANNPSTAQESPESRARELKAMHAYISSNDKYQFSCGAMRAILSRKPDCASCPIEKQGANNPEVIAKAMEHLYLGEKHGGYYTDSDCVNLIAPFKLQRDCSIKNEDTLKVESATMVVTVQMTGTSYKVWDFSEEAWLSKQNFKKELSGLDGVGFLGSDNDVVRLRMTIARDDLRSGAEIKEGFKASKMGLGYRRRVGAENPRDPTHKGRFTYIEPDFSLNDVGVEGTHKLIGEVIGAPKMRVRNFNDPISPACNEAFALLLKSNRPNFIAATLGWFLTTHIKQHIYQLEQRFPLLCLSGTPGTGKNATTKVMMRVCGVEGEAAKWTLEAPNATKLPFQQALSNSSTIPRIINELNPKSLDNRHYRMVLEILKAAYDSQSITKGMIGGGDRASGYNVSSYSWRVSSPVVALSEEPITDTAVVHRAILLDMTPAMLQYGQAAFLKLEPRADDLIDIGRVLIKAALTTSIKGIAEILDNIRLPPGVEEASLQDRIKFNYRAIRTGYRWFVPALERAGLSAENVQALTDLERVLMEGLSESLQILTSVSNTTEVDRLVQDIALMANESLQGTSAHASWALHPGVHFAVHGNTLLLDTATIYPKLGIYKGATRTTLNIVNEQSFLSLIRAAPYFTQMGGVPDGCDLQTGGRQVLHLDITKMLEKGMYAQMFMGG